MKVAIFTLTKNRLSYTKLFLASLLKNTHLPYDHYIIDQASNDGTIEYLEDLNNQLGNLKIFPLTKNLGINRGINFALDQIGHDYDVIVKLDNDALIETDNWLGQCLMVMNPKLILSPYITGLMENRGGVPRIGFDKEKNIGFTPFIGGICQIGVTRAWFEDSGGFDFPSVQYVPDSDLQFCLHLSSKGYIFGYKEDVTIHHMDTTLGQEKKYPQYFHLRQSEKTCII